MKAAGKEKSKSAEPAEPVVQKTKKAAPVKKAKPAKKAAPVKRVKAAKKATETPAE